MPVVEANPKHEAAYQDMIAALRKHDCSPIEMLALIANLCGKVIALQDQRRITPDDAMKIVALNIQLGNQQAIADLAQSQEGSA